MKFFNFFKKHALTLGFTLMGLLMITYLQAQRAKVVNMEVVKEDTSKPEIVFVSIQPKPKKGLEAKNLLLICYPNKVSIQPKPKKGLEEK